MTVRTLILRSLRFHCRAHLGVVLGAAVGSAALIGALVVGDSVRGSLRDRALERLGRIQFALAPADRFFGSGLAQRMPGWPRDSWRVDGGKTSVCYETKPVGLLTLPALAARGDGAARANRVNLIGATHDPNYGGRNDYVCFWDLAPGDRIVIRPGEVWLNPALAAQLTARVGDTLVFRVHKPGALSRDTPIAPRADASVALRLRVAGVCRADELGNFSLRPSQTPPLNAFVNPAELQQAAELDGRVNLLVAPGICLSQPSERSRFRKALEWVGFGLPENERPPQYLKPDKSLGDFARDLKAAARLDDYEARLNALPGGAIELASRRIFLDPALARTALTAQTNGSPLLTYLVNLLRAGTNTTPYSMATAAGPPWTPQDMRDDEIVINQWLADDLKLKPGDTLDLAYFQPESGARLVEVTNRFRVRTVVPVEGIHADRTLMPEFPGVAKAESTHDWDAGFPLVHKFREKDDQYWKEHRGTPKAFVTLAAGQKMWGNRFGNLTAIRFPVPPNTTAPAFRGALESNLLSRLKPEDLGLRFEPVREQALKAANEAQDFGQLFLGFSFFLIIAALILMGLLFQFGLEQRTKEIGTLLALGFTPRLVRRLFLWEGTALAFFGGVLGVLGGLAYARAMLHGLTTVWRDAVGTSALGFHVTAATLVTGLAASVVVSALTIALVLRQQARRPARELLAGEGEFQVSGFKFQVARRSAWLAAVTGGGAVAIVGWALATKQTAAAGAFFGAGSLLLMAGLFIAAAWFARLTNSAGGRTARLTLVALAVRALARRRKRSLAVAGLLACGSFLIVAIGAFKLDANEAAAKRSSGTGGFALIGEATLPVVQDLNSAAGREFFGLDEADLAGVSVVPLRVRDGDDASCLNLNRAQKPRLLGVKPELLASRGAFTFASVAKGFLVKDGWELLRSSRRKEALTSQLPIANRQSPIDQSLLTSAATGDDEIPAIGDAASIQWALGKKVGDTLDFVDERGRPFKVRLVGALANSILQGSLLISEEAFLKRFPGESGHRMFLVDAPSNSVSPVSTTLSRALQDVGLELTPAARRLAQFNAVQNTYLNTFQVLGGLGLLLGSAGLGVVVLRNVLERRGELALLQAVGFRRRVLRWLVLGEHGGLLWIGLGVGTVAALVAILPVLLAPGAEVQWRPLAATLAGVLVSGMAWTWVATWAALRGRLLDGLRNE